MIALKRWCSRQSTSLLLLVVCLAMMVFLSIQTQSFFSLKNVVNILEANSYRLLLACGMMCIISSGAIDLSVGSILSFSAICTAMALKGGLSVGLSIPLALALGGIMGAINGLLIHFTRINAFIITLATAFLYRGLSLIATQGIPITKLPQGFRSFGCGDLFGMESGVTMALLVIVLLIPLFYHMRWGTYVTSLGGNPEALKRSGVPIGRYRVSVFVLMGALSALAGIIVTARLNSAEANAGLNSPGSVLLLDEPTAAMGIQESHSTLQMLSRLRERGMTQLIISHNLHQVFALADFIYVLRSGHIIAGAATADTTIDALQDLILRRESEVEEV